MTAAFDRPAIRLMHAPDAPVELVRAFEHGCEEEGVPVVAVSAAFGNASAMARAAASQSTLFIGAGIDNGGRIALHEHRLNERAHVFEQNATPETARGAGIAAGRLARSRPIPDVVANNDV